ncbi:hypothetical protein J2Y88_000863 [Pseudomonas chlororaphis]|nr:hypothetical protein [Pseudomonas chlororaphis]MCP1478552.1 hypothetical protein [Pseudomonas chlororaphis]MCP1595096.1 hypothetical protein [Pseudomonas chlororaphis]
MSITQFKNTAHAILEQSTPVAVIAANVANITQVDKLTFRYTECLCVLVC